MSMDLSWQAAQEQLLSFLHEGLDVYDSQNHKIVSVSKTYPPAGPNEGFFIEVNTSFLGLGHTRLSPTVVHALVLFIPSNYLTLSDGQLELTVERAEIDQMGWNQRPAPIWD